MLRCDLLVGLTFLAQLVLIKSFSSGDFVGLRSYHIKFYVMNRIKK